jgi:tripartite-type tricarboxylate transporter receptor subunit TctC
MLRTIKLSGLAVAFVAASIGTSLSRASAQSADEDFPVRPITLIVPFAAGGLVDLIARVTAQGLSDELGKTITVENRPGAGGAIAATTVANAAANGYTLLATDISFVSVPQVLERKSYNPAKDFKMVGSTGRSALALAVSPSIKVDTLRDFVHFSSKPESNATFAHAGIGSTPHLAAVSFAQAANIRPLLVPYGGMTPATNDLVGNRITAAFMGTPQAAELAGKGMLKTLGVTSQRRVASNPDVPTFSESGLTLAGFEHGTWYGIAAPAGTPDAVIQKLNAALNRALKRLSVVERFAPADVIPFPTSATEFQNFVADQSRNWSAVLEKAKIKAQ